MPQLPSSLQWHHNERNGVWNHQHQNCLLNRLFRRRSKKTSKLHVSGLCEGNSPVTSEFPTQRVSNAETFSIWWRHLDPRCPSGFPFQEEYTQSLHPPFGLRYRRMFNHTSIEILLSQITIWLIHMKGMTDLTCISSWIQLCKQRTHVDYWNV